MNNSAAEEVPQSVEEAGALLGAAILRCGTSSHTIVVPPKGMHSSFATVSPVPSSELLTGLHSLRTLLQSEPQGKPLIAAPSLLAVLMKLLGVSSSLATALLATAPTASNDSARRATTPPMLSTPLRQLWVDCVVLCHVLGQGLSGNARIDIYAFLRTMSALAATNPKSAKAAGGTRIAALQVMGGLFVHPILAPKLAPWVLDIFQLCHKGLKSSGNGEPTYRITAVRTACCIALGCRDAYLQTHPHENNDAVFILAGAMEDRPIVEVCKLIRQATTDKFPEVRSAAANLASIMAPMLIYSSFQNKSSGDASGSASPTTSLEEVLLLAIKNLDDEMAGVAVAWADAAARCLATSAYFGQQIRLHSESNSRRNAEDDVGGGAGAESSATSSGETTRFSSRKAIGLMQQCSSLSSTVAYLVDHFVKVGGELAAPRGGGSFSSGGRAARIGVSLALLKFLRLQAKAGNIGQGSGMSTEEAISRIIIMVGPELEKQLKVPEARSVGDDLDATSTSVHSPEKPTSLFGGGAGRNKSHADAGLARLAASRVLRQGLSEMAPEPIQLKILRELIALCNKATTGLEEGHESVPFTLNSHQLQVVLIEISHLMTTLGEAAASCLPDLVPVLQICLADHEHGVRHEAAITCAAMAFAFPMSARKLLRSSLDEIQLNHTELVKLASLGRNGPRDDGSPIVLRRFLRTTAKPVHPSLIHQYSIHGHALMISLLCRELPHLPGGLPTELLTSGLLVAEILVNCQFNDVLIKSNPGAACTCVRAGYGIICGAFTIGATSIIPHTDLIFDLWKKIGLTTETNRNFTPDHVTTCLDAALSSVVAFLQHCSELLLIVPDALSRSTLLLEKLLPMFLPEGRLGGTASSHAAASRQESATASLMEAFAWLPPGSFPMVANQVFSLAARHIKTATEAEVTCSLLPSLVNNEDEILDAKSLDRAQRYGQVGGARDIEENLIALLSDAAHHGERESVLHFQTSKVKRNTKGDRNELRGSQLLGMFYYDGMQSPAPTPLHEVGTWRQPTSPSCCSKVRLIDAAVQSFSATFGLKDGKEQQHAMLMLESLVPPFLAQLARVIGVNTSLSEPERRTKAKDENAAIANITAVLLACLQALPLHEATHDVPIGLGPPWMNKARDLLLTLLPSTSNTVRRAAAEGLALLATLGVTEDAHTLQSTVLRSLDEVMQGNQPDGKPRPIPLEPVSAARAGSLLTLACIQRTAHRIKEKHRARARGRSKNSEGASDLQDDALPTIQMMTRLLPSLACHGVLRDAFVVRTYAMHSFGLLVAYSAPLGRSSLSVESQHLLKKAVEVVDDNFLASWTAVAGYFDKGQESEILAAEASFLSVLLRLMTFLVPALPFLDASMTTIANRFSLMATLILENYGAHPVVVVEAFAFFERLSSQPSLLTPLALVPSENALTPCIPFIIESITPCHPILLAGAGWLHSSGCLASRRALRVAVRCSTLMSLAMAFGNSADDVDLPAVLFALLEMACGTRSFPSETLYRPLAAPREADIANNDQVAMETEVVETIDTLLLLASDAQRSDGQALLHWILFSRFVLVGAADKTTSDENESDHEAGRITQAVAARKASMIAKSSTAMLFDYSFQCRWQVKCQAARCATAALQELSAAARRDGNTTSNSKYFNPKLAHEAFTSRYREIAEEKSNQPTSIPSYLVFHVEEVLTSACSSTVASLDQSELRQLQEGGVRLLGELVFCFGSVPDPDEPRQGLLDQYASQIFSSLKHAVTIPAEEGEEISGVLFISGWKVLQMIVEKGLVVDPLVLKRLVRPALPLVDEIPFCAYGDVSSELSLRQAEETHFRNQRAALLPRVGKLWTLGKLRQLADNGTVSEAVAQPMLEELKAFKCEIAVHSAAVAIDGARLLRGAGLSLAGTVASDLLQGTPTDEISEAGLIYSNIGDLDDTAKAAIVEAWPACACNAMVLLVEIYDSTDIDEGRRAECATWLDKLLPFVFVGLDDVLSAFRVNIEKSAVLWTKGLELEEVGLMCLHGLRVLVNSDIEVPGDELACVVSSILISVILPTMRLMNHADQLNSNMQQSDDTVFSGSCNSLPSNLVTEACQFIESVASSLDHTDHVESAVLLAILTPLNAMQNGTVAFGNKLVTEIIASCLRAVSTRVRRPDAKEALVNAMMQLSADLLSRNMDAPEDVTKAAETLFGYCLDHDAIPASQQQALARELAMEGKWDAWSIMCAHSEPGLSFSMSVVRSHLNDFQSAQNQVAALSAVRRVVQGADIPSPRIGKIMHGLGAQVLVLLQAYGTLSNVPKDVQGHRTSVCADAMKITLAGFQELVADPTGDESPLTPFLFVLFQVLVSVIAYNGLPNQTSPHTGADPTLGRLSAHAIVYVARTAPAAFKASMATLSEHGRALLELAVRAEMSGYASTTGNAPAKKILNLQGFKK